MKNEFDSFGSPSDNGSSTMRGTEVLELPDFTPAVKRSLRDNENETVWTVVSFYFKQNRTNCT